MWRAAVPPDVAASRIDLRAHATHFPPLAEPGFNPVAVRRIYEVLDEREAGPAGPPGAADRGTRAAAPP